MNEPELLNALRGGSIDARQELILQYQGLIRSRASANVDIFDDVVSNANVRLLELLERMRLGTWDYRKDSIKSLIWRVVFYGLRDTINENHTIRIPVTTKSQVDFKIEVVRLIDMAAKDKSLVDLKDSLFAACSTSIQKQIVVELLHPDGPPPDCMIAESLKISESSVYLNRQRIATKLLKDL